MIWSDNLVLQGRLVFAIIYDKKYIEYYWYYKTLRYYLGRNGNNAEKYRNGQRCENNVGFPRSKVVQSASATVQWTHRLTFCEKKNWIEKENRKHLPWKTRWFHTVELSLNSRLLVWQWLHFSLRWTFVNGELTFCKQECGFTYVHGRRVFVCKHL